MKYHNMLDQKVELHVAELSRLSQVTCVCVQKNTLLNCLPLSKYSYKTIYFLVSGFMVHFSFCCILFQSHVILYYMYSVGHIYIGSDQPPLSIIECNVVAWILFVLVLDDIEKSLVRLLSTKLSQIVFHDNRMREISDG